MPDQVHIQRTYYQRTADHYDSMHLGDQEHELALSVMTAMVRHFNFHSVLDVGSGTGRAIVALRQAEPDLKIIGIEPSTALREHGYNKGIPTLDLIDGDAQALAFDDGSFDLVCSFGVLHHVSDPHKAISEMLRVARRAIFISDNNDFGRGRIFSRAVKQALHITRLWWPLEMIKTSGKGYRITPDDGLWYSFTLFDHLPLIRSSCSQLHMLNTDGSGPNLFRSAGHIALLGLIRPDRQR